MRQSTKDILFKTENHLNKLSNQLIEELTKIIEGDWGLSKSANIGKVNLLDIEVFVDGYRLGLYPMDSSSTQLGYRSLLQEEYSNGLLNEEELNPNLDEYDFKKQEDNEELDEFEKAQKEIFIKWFTGCWNKTDNRKLSIPIYLTFHDTGDTFDLKGNKWVKEK
jgi:hypothetical protein